MGVPINLVFKVRGGFDGLKRAPRLDERKN